MKRQSSLLRCDGVHIDSLRQLSLLLDTLCSWRALDDFHVASSHLCQAKCDAGRLAEIGRGGSMEC